MVALRGEGTGAIKKSGRELGLWAEGWIVPRPAWPLRVREERVREELSNLSQADQIMLDRIQELLKEETDD